MKTSFYSLTFLFLLALFVGCKEQPPKDQLTLGKEKICLQFGKTEQCMDAAGSYRLHLVDGKPVFEALDLGKALCAPSYPQFGKPSAIRTEKLGVIIENKVLSLQDGERRITDAAGLGFILVRDTKGAISLCEGMDAKVAPQRHLWATRDRAMGRMDWTASRPSKDFLLLTQISFALGDAANRYIPNDTGTEVVIIDNFKVVGDCQTEAPDSCCPAGESAGPPITVTDDMVNGYAQNDLRLLACFPVNSICTFTDGDKLIVIVCESQQRYCLDYSVCNVTITTTDGNGICISVPSNCAMENPFN